MIYIEVTIFVFCLQFIIPALSTDYNVLSFVNNIQVLNIFIFTLCYKAEVHFFLYVLEMWLDHQSKMFTLTFHQASKEGIYLFKKEKKQTFICWQIVYAVSGQSVCEINN